MTTGGATATAPTARTGPWLLVPAVLVGGVTTSTAAVLVDAPLVAIGFSGAVSALAVFALTRRDSATLVQLYVLLLLLVPSRLAVEALGGAGTPSVLIGFALGALWLSGALVPSLRLDLRSNPVRAVALAFLSAALLGHLAAFMRPIDSLEARGADRGLVIAASSVGLVLFVADTLRDRRRLDAVVQAVVVAGAAVAVVGMLQFTIGYDLTEHIRIPGLTATDTSSAISERSIFRRVAGTTAHGIEFGVALSMVLPLALHVALHGQHERRKLWWVPVVLIGMTIPMSVSRSAVVGVAGVFLVLLPCWPKHTRHLVLLGLAAYAVAMKVVFPGLLGTIRGLFLSVGVDYSVTSRTNDYGYVDRFFSQNPLMGRGIGTFIPSRYDFIDNQYLVSLVEGGLIMLVTYAVLWVAGIVTALTARRRLTRDDDRHLAAAIAAGLMVPLLTSATFDFLAFGTARGLAFLLLGMAGALFHLVHKEPPAAVAATEPDDTRSPITAGVS